MREIKMGERTISILNQQSEATLTQYQRRARPSEKQMRAALKERPAFREISALLPDIWRVAYCTTYDDHDLEQYDPGQLVTPAAYWEYLSFAGEDHEERTVELELAIKTLQAIRAAKPNPSN